jgi:hypothetical protein
MIKKLSLMPNSRRQIFSHPKIVLLLGSILVVALVVVTFAYLTSLPPRIGPRASILSDPIEFSIELNKTDFQQGENVTVTFSLINTSNKTITITWSSYYYAFAQRLYFDFYIIDTNGTRIYQWSHGAGAFLAGTSMVVNPGEQVTNFYKWPQVYSGRTGYDAIVPKGTYSVVGLTRGMIIYVDSQESGIMLETPSITFTTN